MDPAGCKGVSNRLFRDPGASSPTKANDSKCRKSSTNRDQSTKTSLQGGYPLTFTHQSRSGVFKHLIPCTEKGGEGGGGRGGGTTPCGKLETFESKHPLRTLQDRGDPYVEGPVEKWGLFSQNRSDPT